MGGSGRDCAMGGGRQTRTARERADYARVQAQKAKAAAIRAGTLVEEVPAGVAWARALAAALGEGDARARAAAAADVVAAAAAIARSRRADGEGAPPGTVRDLADAKVPEALILLAAEARVATVKRNVCLALAALATTGEEGAEACAAAHVRRAAPPRDTFGILARILCEGHASGPKRAAASALRACTLGSAERATAAIEAGVTEPLADFARAEDPADAAAAAGALEALAAARPSERRIAARTAEEAKRAASSGGANIVRTPGGLQAARDAGAMSALRDLEDSAKRAAEGGTCAAQWMRLCVPGGEEKLRCSRPFVPHPSIRASANRASRRILPPGGDTPETKAAAGAAAAAARALRALELSGESGD